MIQVKTQAELSLEKKDFDINNMRRRSRINWGDEESEDEAREEKNSKERFNRIVNEQSKSSESISLSLSSNSDSKKDLISSYKFLSEEAISFSKIKGVKKVLRGSDYTKVELENGKSIYDNGKSISSKDKLIDNVQAEAIVEMAKIKGMMNIKLKGNDEWIKKIALIAFSKNCFSSIKAADKSQQHLIDALNPNKNKNTKASTESPVAKNFAEKAFTSADLGKWKKKSDVQDVEEVKKRAGFKG